MRTMHEFVMPSLGADMESGSVIEWLVEPGEAVRRGQMVCVVETQTGAVEVEIWEAGTVERLLAEPGQTIAAAMARHANSEITPASGGSASPSRAGHSRQA